MSHIVWKWREEFGCADLYASEKWSGNTVTLSVEWSGDSSYIILSEEFLGESLLIRRVGDHLHIGSYVLDFVAYDWYDRCYLFVRNNDLTELFSLHTDSSGGE